MLVQLFGHTDLTLTDVLAAFLMLAEWQREKRQQALDAILGHEGPDVDDDDDAVGNDLGPDDGSASEASGLDGEQAWCRSILHGGREFACWWDAVPHRRGCSQVTQSVSNRHWELDWVSTPSLNPNPKP